MHFSRQSFQSPHRSYLGSQTRLPGRTGRDPCARHCLRPRGTRSRESICIAMPILTTSAARSGRCSITGADQPNHLWRGKKPYLPRLRQAAQAICARRVRGCAFPRRIRCALKRASATPNGAPCPGVTLTKVVKRYGDVQVIQQGIDLEIGRWRVLRPFVGPSLRQVHALCAWSQGLEETTRGPNDPSAHPRCETTMDPVRARCVDGVPRPTRFIPHMTVEQNMGFGLKMTGTLPDEIMRRWPRPSKILKTRRLPQAQTRRAVRGPASARCHWARAMCGALKVFLFR